MGLFLFLLCVIELICKFSELRHSIVLVLIDLDALIGASFLCSCCLNVLHELSS